MPAARHCKNCGIDWPNHLLQYKVCPKCEGKLAGIVDGTPLPKDEALSLKRHCEFERYYQKHEHKRLKAEKKLIEGAFK
jgi:hypothetical protein